MDFLMQQSPHPVSLKAPLLLVPSPAFLSLARLAAKYRCHLGLISPGHSSPIALSSLPGLKMLNRFLVLPSSGVLIICYNMDERGARTKVLLLCPSPAPTVNGKEAPTAGRAEQRVNPQPHIEPSDLPSTHGPPHSAYPGCQA